MDLDEEITDLLADAGDRLLRLAFQLCHNQSTAEDLVQQALERTYRSWRRHRPDVAHAEAYVRRAIINEHVSRRRLRSAGEVVTDRVPEVSAPAADAGLGTRDALWRAVTDLPPRQRAVLVLRYYEDLSDAEIAEVIGARQNTVRSLASRGVATLRAGIGALGDLSTKGPTR